MIHTPVNTYGQSIPIFAFGAQQDLVVNASGGGATNASGFSDNIEAVLVTAQSGNDFRMVVQNAAGNAAPGTIIPTPCMFAVQMPRGGTLSVSGLGASPGLVSVTEIVSKAQNLG